MQIKNEINDLKLSLINSDDIRKNDNGDIDFDKVLKNNMTFEGFAAIECGNGEKIVYDGDL